jgi:molecular chaperone GrpE (heat shock protein)
MDKPLTVEPTAEETAKMQAEIAQWLAEIAQLREHMKRDQAIIDASRARTRAMLAKLKTG